MTFKCEICGQATRGYTVSFYASDGDDYKMVAERLYTTLWAAMKAIQAHLEQ